MVGLWGYHLIYKKYRWVIYGWISEKQIYKIPSLNFKFMKKSMCRRIKKSKYIYIKSVNLNVLQTTENLFYSSISWQIMR